MPEFETELFLADQVERKLLKRINDLSGSSGGALPSQLELAEEYDVSLRTIRTVVNRLKAHSLIRSVKGKGMFVLPQKTSDAKQVLIVVDGIPHFYKSVAVGQVTDFLLQRDLCPKIVDSKNIFNLDGEAYAAFVINATEEGEQELIRRRIPYVLINDAIASTKYLPSHGQCVRVNSYQWAYSLAELAIRMGKTNLFSADGDQRYFWAQERRRGILNACHDYGVAFPPENSIELYMDNSSPRSNISYTEFRKKLETAHAKNPDNLALFDVTAVSCIDTEFHHEVLRGERFFNNIYTMDFMNSGKPFISGIRLEFSLSDLIFRAAELLFDHVKPLAPVEELCTLTVTRKEGYRWVSHPYRDFLTAFDNNKQFKNSN